MKISKLSTDDLKPPSQQKEGHKFRSADDLSLTLGSNATECTSLTPRQPLSQPGTILSAFQLVLSLQAGASHPMAQLSFLQHSLGLSTICHPDLGIPEQLPLLTLNPIANPEKKKEGLLICFAVMKSSHTSEGLTGAFVMVHLSKCKKEKFLRDFKTTVFE